MIIGICGYKGAGKDTVGDYLVEKYGFKKRSFAEPLKQAVAALFGISREDVDNFKEVITTYGGNRASVILQVHLDNLDNVKVAEYEFEWREFLQRFGTEMGRETFGRNFWVNQMEYSPFEHTVITDVRFGNEVNSVTSNGGVIWYVDRPGIEPDGHASEELPLDDFTQFVHIPNYGSIEELYENVDGCMRMHRSKLDKTRRKKKDL